jgi:hypothetical protein
MKFMKFPPPVVIVDKHGLCIITPNAAAITRQMLGMQFIEAAAEEFREVRKCFRKLIINQTRIETRAMWELDQMPPPFAKALKRFPLLLRLSLGMENLSECFSVINNSELFLAPFTSYSLLLLQ